MEEAACGAQFRAAVQVIQGLPRSATTSRRRRGAAKAQGPASGTPSAGTSAAITRRDAWHSLGRMSKEEAMVAYVAEMKKVAQKIIDTVPMDETTEEMFGYFEPLYEVIHDMPRPPEAFFKRKGGSQEQTADPSQDDPASSPAPERPEDALPREQRNRQHVPGGGLSPTANALEGSQVTSDSEGDVYCDTLEQMEPEQAGQLLGLSLNGVQAGPEPPMPCSAGQGERAEGRRLEGRSSAGLAALGSKRDLQFTGGEQDIRSTLELATGLPVELDACVASTVRALQDDMRRVLERLSELETLASAQGDTAGPGPGQPLAEQAPSSWPLALSPRTLFFLITWPFVTQWLLRRWQGRKRPGPLPRGRGATTANCHRHSQDLASTAGTAKGPAIPGEQSVGSPPHPEWDPGGSPRYRTPTDGRTGCLLAPRPWVGGAGWPLSPETGCAKRLNIGTCLN
ncbi:acyl-CoA-binding domain-containing protein 4 isoform X2 [Phalacrocorax aristotelis]|uniref:acyl-CoA-binding domain-containing protein 4 isoform X2 n=1 Tax=Phalacrocorax aristotelis TaxID=126867 RepID=UPI003F4BA2B9